MAHNPAIMKMLAAIALAASCFASAAHAQAPLSETIEVRITNIDVVVTDRTGAPVTGLTKDDFEILESGKRQAVTNFYEIRDASAAAPASSGEMQAPLPEVPAEVSRRRIVIFVDNFTIHPLSRNQAFAAVEKSLSTLLRPGDEAMIVMWQGTDQTLAPFTSDHEELIAQFRKAAKRTGGGTALFAARTHIIDHAAQMIADANTPAKHKISHGEAYQITMESSRAFAEQLYSTQKNLMKGLEQTLTTLAGVEGKKVLVFIGAELADNPGMEIFQQVDAMFQQYLPQIRPAVMRESSRSLSLGLRNVAARANANGVTMYLVDSADRRRNDGSDYMVDPGAAFINETNSPMAMATVAALTGGISVAGGRGFEKALDTIAHDLSFYYSLGYRSPAEGEGDRRVVVKVKNPALRVRSRSSYVARVGDDEIRERVTANVFHDAVTSDFPVTLEASTPERIDRGQFKIVLTITFPSTLTLIPQDGFLQGSFSVFVATGRKKGAVSEVTKSLQPMKFPLDARQALDQQKTFTYTTTLLVRSGEQNISVGIIDTLAGTAGFARTNVIAQ